MTRAGQLSSALGFQLDLRSGVPVYRQIMDQVLGAMASGRQLAVDLSINPNTVIRAYRELEIRGFLDTHQGSGTFITPQPVQQDNEERQRKLDAIVSYAIARAGAEGFTAQQVFDRLRELLDEQKTR